ncbi:aldose epimerase family protein [Thalassoglobus polymorphus]|uniref:Aldose 1-epimerase n=1 Tax=Thalassoglobus polymorphus TaxID=2527994 RepID=A0A517QN81_9PLAN|nr:aldose epimerase family protein [Thalassoglobus polymorphus]QDT33100.1 Aldose 1-epimerase precursor [Thalassoglobus polymorphus]
MWRLQFYVAVMATFLTTSISFSDVPVAQPFGKTKDGTPVDLYTLENQNGMKVDIMTRGATIVRIDAPDKNGNFADVVLGFDDVAGYESEENQYFGCTTGRVANRIAKGKFHLNGRDYTLAINNEPNHLHGGVERSLDKVVWKARPFENAEGQGVHLRYVSPHGEEGYPGTLSCKVEFLLHKATNDLQIRYWASTDQSTPVNLTNHSYFNLAGAGSPTVLNHELMLSCRQYTPVDETLIPTGEIESVTGTPLDFLSPQVIGERIEKFDDGPTIGYDHNFVIDGEAGNLRIAAKLKDPASGRVLTVKTDQPGVQFYSGNFLKGQTGKLGKTYPHRSAICLETQFYPDSINQPTFPSIVLKPWEEYRHECVYSFSAE